MHHSDPSQLGQIARGLPAIVRILGEAESREYTGGPRLTHSPADPDQLLTIP